MQLPQIQSKILFTTVIITFLYSNMLSGTKAKEMKVDSCNNTATGNKAGYYGDNCEIPCNCLKDEPCSKATGACSNGCKQWFTVNPSLPLGNCNTSIDLPGIPVAGLKSVEETWASFNVQMNKNISKYLSRFYYYEISCIDEDTGYVANFTKIKHNSLLDSVIVTVNGLKMVTKYNSTIVIVCEQNGNRTTGAYLAIEPSFTTKCNRPTAPLLHSNVWPDRIVFFYWDIKEIQPGCDKATISKMVLSMDGEMANAQTNQWHPLLLDLNYTVLTGLSPGMYDFMLRVETDQNLTDDSPVIKVSVPKAQLIIMTKTKWSNALGVLISFLLICLIIIGLLLFYIQRKKYMGKRTLGIPIDDGDMYEQNFTDGNVIQRILPHQDSSSSQTYTDLIPESRSQDSEAYTTLPLRNFNNADANLNNNDFERRIMNKKMSANTPQNKTSTHSTKSGADSQLYENVPTSKKKSTAIFNYNSKKAKKLSKKVNNNQKCSSSVARPPIAVKPNLKLQHQTGTGTL